MVLQPDAVKLWDVLWTFEALYITWEVRLGTDCLGVTDVGKHMNPSVGGTVRYGYWVHDVAVGVLASVWLTP